jgi:hypothetical protein
MTKINSSPERYSFQVDMAKKRAEEDGKEVPELYMEFWKTAKQQDTENLLDPEWQKNNMEFDLRSNKELCDKVKARDEYAQNLYAAMCNMQFQKLDVMPILKNELWSASWRKAGGIVADMQEKGDYIDWYCSGMGGLSTYDVKEGEEYMEKMKYVPEGQITDEIKEDLKTLGWIPVPYEDDKNV